MSDYWCEQWGCPWGCMGVCYGRGVGDGMGVLHLMRVMIISYFMTVICVGRGGVGGYRYILITFLLICDYVTLYLKNIISINLLTQNVGV